jgi:sigma-B regulation protein RsbU (phosphoserine phosphatase)
LQGSIRDIAREFRSRGLLFCFVFLAASLAVNGFAPHATAQISSATFDASNLRQPADLDTAWRFHAGDDPAYASPDFDDSQWKLFNPHTDIKTVFQKQHPEIIWYRLRVKVSPDQAGLALREHSLSRAFEIYVNGERLIAAGRIAPFAPYTLYAYVVQRIPDRLLVNGSLLIALRVHIAPVEWGGQGPGYSAGNLAIGQEVTLDRDDWLAILGDNALLLLDRVLNVCLGLVALVLFAAQRRNTEYLWIAAVGLLSLAELPVEVVGVFRNVPLHWEVITDLFRVATPFLLAGLYFSFVHQKIGWRWRIFLIFAGLMNAFNALQGILFTSSASIQLVSNLPFVVLLSVILPIVLTIHWRRGNREAGILLIPVVLLSLYVYAEIGLGALFQIPAWRDFALRGLTVIDHFPVGPFFVSGNALSGILSTLALAIIMLLRSTTMSRRQALLEGELAAAQQVQQVLLPEQTESVPGFAVETVYQPAQQVGGDFFQVLPAGEGGLLVVVGDVAGKGLPAAMLVSVLVGVIRGVAGYTRDPAELLAKLNERLVGRGGGSFSTALVAHIASNGQVTVANAGHLSPYLDGKEIVLAGALPLGVMSGTVYEASQFHLSPGSRLTFYSDGVVEAQNKQGELFGFDRARELSTQPAAAIAEAAKKFGQEDDITVVTIARDAAIASAA